jgi:hypothetical protein
MVQRLERPSMTVDAYIDMLERQSLPDTAAALRDLFTAAGTTSHSVPEAWVGPLDKCRRW